jgi:hypothetical protein
MHPTILQPLIPLMRSVLALVTAAVFSAGIARAQETQQVQVTFIPQARVDLIAGSVTALQAGLGVVTPLDNYFAIGGTVAAGISRTGFSGRGDLYGRFSLDPYHTYYWEPYLGGGVTVRADAGGPGTRTYLLGLVGLDGPSAGGIAPGVEIGIGGGVRLGVTLRWATPPRTAVPH